MIFTEYAAPDTPNEALRLLKERKGRIAAGNLWLRMSSRTAGTMIDLKELGWNSIEETEDAWIIGASVSLHQLETHEGLDQMTGGLFRAALRSVVGVQFRNAATVGGSLYMRAGFSDVLALLLPLNTTVLLYPETEIRLEDYARQAPERELIRGIRIPKQKMTTAYRALRCTSGNVPVLTCAVALREDGIYAAIGARPYRAELIGGPGETKESLIEKALSLRYGTNTYATAPYRRHVAGVLLGRCLADVLDREGERA